MERESLVVSLLMLGWYMCEEVSSRLVPGE